MLVASLLLAVNHGYLITRTAGYWSGQADGGRRWIVRRRKIVRHGSPQSGKGLWTIDKRIAFLTAELLLSTTTVIAVTVVGVISLFGVLVAGLVGSVPSETAGLAAGLVPLALVMASLVVARAELAAVLFVGPSGPARPLVTYGRLPQHAPATLRRSFGLRAVAAHLVYPGPAAALLAAAAVPALIALDLRGVELGLLVGLLVLHLAVANWVLYVDSRRWWRELPERLNGPTTFPRGTNPPTQRVLVDVVTPLGPNSDIAELGGVLSDHRALERSAVRWSIVTEPDRTDEVSRFVRQLFELHGCRPPGSRVRVVAATETKPGPKRNHGARLATAPFVSFIDSDDRVDLLRLVAAVNVALVSEKALQSVHLFPFYTLTQDGIRLRPPGALHRAPIVHHHSARLWPSGVFRSGVASYGDTDYEDAILTIDMAATLDHCLHNEPDTAFMTYADHRNAPGRLTRSYKDASHLLRRLAQEAIAEADPSALGKPSSREKVLIDTFVSRVAAEVAWGRETTLDIMRTGVAEFAPYRLARRGQVDIAPELIASSIEGIRKRNRSVRVSDNGRGLVRFIRDELAAKVSRTTTLTPMDRDHRSQRILDERQLGLLIGLMNADPSSLRPSSLAPTVFYNLDGDKYDVARRAVHFFAREPYFRLESDPSVPRGDVEVHDPLDDSRRRLGSFDTDRLMSSKLLRLWDRFFPSITEVEQARAHVVLHDLGLTSQSPVVRLVGTGPSSMAALDARSTRSGITTICCNSWVRRPDRMREMGAKMLTAADPIFHAGPSEYARQFRADLAAWLRADPEHLFLTVSRDISVYLSELPADVHDQIVAVAFDAAIDADDPLPLETGLVQPYPNILTLLMLPLAENLRPSEVLLYGFDGGAKGAEEYWKYDPEANYSEELQQTVRRWHPEFFQLDYAQYRDEHDEHVALWLRRLSDQGIEVRASAPSNILAVDAAFRANSARETMGTI